MKNLLFVLLFSIFSINSFSQNVRISLNKTSEDGIQVIATNSSWIKTSLIDPLSLSYQLFCGISLNKETKVYSISIGLNTYNTKGSIPQNGILLIKTSNDEIIELQHTGKTEHAKYVSADKYMTTYYVSATYEITLDDLVKITKYGIQKIRIETGLDYREVSYKPKYCMKIADLFNNMYTAIQNEMKTNKKDIYSDF